MKNTVGIIAALILTMTASLAAYAANNESKSLTLFQSVEVNGTTLEPGTYKVSFDATGSATQVTFSQGKKDIVSAPAHLKSLSQKKAETQIRMNDTGAIPRLEEIDFRGSTTAITFVEPAGSTGE